MIAAHERGQPVRILLVEDEALIALMLEDMVEGMGCAVTGLAPRIALGVTLADLELDPARGDGRRAGTALGLTRQEFLLLSLLVRRRGEVLSRAFIAEQVWDMRFDSDTNIVDVAVRRLRRKLDDPFPVKLIHTVRGLGYVLELR